MAKIALIDVDSKIPNLALMKISAYHKEKRDLVKWYEPLWDIDIDKIYMSKTFTFTRDYQYTPKSIELEKGGTGYDIKKTLPEEIDNAIPDYSIYPNYNQEVAIGFITRGCIRNCNFCVVQQKEGKIRYYSNIEKILQGRTKAKLLDNNILASPEGTQEIEKIAKLGIKVDFNQGLDHRLIDDTIAKILSKVKWLRPLTMACDDLKSMDSIKPAIELLRKHGVKPQRYCIYVLAKDIESALTRIKFLNELKCDPYIQTYIDFRTGEKPNKAIERLERYVNHKAIFRTVTWEQYKQRYHL